MQRKGEDGLKGRWAMDSIGLSGRLHTISRSTFSIIGLRKTPKVFHSLQSKRRQQSWPPSTARVEIYPYLLMSSYEICETLKGLHSYTLSISAILCPKNATLSGYYMFRFILQRGLWRRDCIRICMLHSGCRLG